MKQTNLNIKLREKFIKQGVKMIAPETVFFSKDTKIGKNVIIEPYVVFGKKVKIKNNVKILIDAEESWIQKAIDIVAIDLMKKYNRKSAMLFLTHQFYIFQYPFS